MILNIFQFSSKLLLRGFIFLQNNTKQNHYREFLLIIIFSKVNQIVDSSQEKVCKIAFKH